MLIYCIVSPCPCLCRVLSALSMLGWGPKARLNQLPLNMCGPIVGNNALRKSHVHSLVLLTRRQSGHLLFQDEHIAQALLWRNIVSGSVFGFTGGAPLEALPKLQCAAASAALFEDKSF